MSTIYSRVVVPFDGSELSKKALDTAINLMKQDEKMELDVITVVNTRSVVHNSALSFVDIEEIRQAELSTAKETLRKLEFTLKMYSNKIRTSVLEGEPSKTICEYIQENNIQLVIMGSRGLSGIQELFLGSVSHHVVQKSTCPVLIIK